MSFEVITSEVRSAADTLRSEVEPLAGQTVLQICYADSAIGHVELMTWMTTVTTQIDDAIAELHGAVGDIAGALDYVASRYDTTDDRVEQCFAQDPIVALGLPEGFDGSAAHRPDTPASQPRLGDRRSRAARPAQCSLRCAPP